MLEKVDYGAGLNARDARHTLVSTDNEQQRYNAFGEKLFLSVAFRKGADGTRQTNAVYMTEGEMEAEKAARLAAKENIGSTISQQSPDGLEIRQSAVYSSNCAWQDLWLYSASQARGNRYCFSGNNELDHDYLNDTDRYCVNVCSILLCYGCCGCNETLGHYARFGSIWSSSERCSDYWKYENSSFHIASIPVNTIADLQGSNTIYIVTPKNTQPVQRDWYGNLFQCP